MNVGELRKALEGRDAEDLVIVEIDGANSEYKELQEVDGPFVFNHEQERISHLDLTPELEERGYSELDILPGDPCIVLVHMG